MSIEEASPIRDWLAKIGLPQFAEQFEADRITLDTLLTLDGDDLKELGVTTIGDRKQILAAIKKLRSAPGPKSIPLPVATTSAAFSSFSPPQFSPASPMGGAVARIPPSPPEIVIAGSPPPPSPSDSVAVAGVAKKKRMSWASFGGRFLIVSVAAHVLFGLGATYYVVQTIQAKRKLTFQGGPKSPNPSTRSVEHKVQMAKKQNTMSAPVQSKRITTTGASKVSLPDMPALPKGDEIVPGKMAGLGGAGVGFSMAGGAGAGGGTGGGAMTLFGFRDARGGSLDGTFYDLKQTSGRKPTGMDNDKWQKFVQSWVKGSWDEGELKKYYAAPRALHAPFIYVPIILADEGPKAFDVEKQVQPRLWVALYKAKVQPTQSGKFRFVGYGDDILIVRFNGRVVLNQHDPSVQAKPRVQYQYAGMGGRGPVAGRWFEAVGGDPYEMEVLIGECPGGLMHAYLLLEKSDGAYDKDPAGLPILPIFRLSKVVPKEMSAEDIKRQAAHAGSNGALIGKMPPYSAKEIPWNVAKPLSGFSSSSR